MWRTYRWMQEMKCLGVLTWKSREKKGEAVCDIMLYQPASVEPAVMQQRGGKSWRRRFITLEMDHKRPVKATNGHYLVKQKSINGHLKTYNSSSQTEEKLTWANARRGFSRAEVGRWFSAIYQLYITLRTLFFNPN